MDLLNDFFVLWYERLFDYTTYNTLLDCVYNNADYGKIGGLMFMNTLILLFVFYKIWDPVKNPKVKWVVSILLIALLSSGSTYYILDMNACIREAIINNNGGGADPINFITQMSVLTFVYSLIIAFVLSIFPFRYFSTNNSHNPF